MAQTSKANDDVARIEELEYITVANVNVSNFVTEKLSGRNNYPIWKEQMLYLLRSHQIEGIIEMFGDWKGTKSKKIVERYETLVRGWILGSINQEVLKKPSFWEDLPIVWKELRSYDTDLVAYYPSKSEIRILSEIVAEDIDTYTELETKLHKYTLEGRWWEAEAILKKNKDAATNVINGFGDTMLHLAVREGNNYLVEKLITFIQDEIRIEQINSAGDTALHVAARVDNKYAAELLVKKRKQLLEITDDISSQTPLEIAYYDMKLSTFFYLFEATKSQHLPSFASPHAKALTYAIAMKQYDFGLKLLKIDPHLATKDDNDSVLMELTRNFPSDLGFSEALIYPLALNRVYQKIAKRSSLLFNSLKFLYFKAKDILWAMRSSKNRNYSWLLPEIVLMLLVPVAAFCIMYQLIHLLILVLLFPFFMSYPYLWKFLVVVVPPIKRIEKKKKDYKEAKEILELICDEINKGSSETLHYYKHYKQPIVEAALLDVSEVVIQVLRGHAKAIAYPDDSGDDVFQSSIKNRSIKVYNLLSPMLKIERYRKMRNGSGNTLMHLASKLASSFVLSGTTGAALQLQRELQWHEEVKKHMLPTELTEMNNDMETSEMMFTREHANLVKEGENWMKTTSESCSITAALIVTIVFAAALTVPGGNNQETGIPMFKKNTAFTIFAVCDAVSLFTAATALLVFLSILTTRFAERDFLVSLPRRLIIGLCALFISTTAMMVAFGAILFLIFCDQRTWMLAPIGVLACLPISVIVTVQLPLVLDLIKSTYFFIFEQKKKHGGSSSFYKLTSIVCH